MTDTNNPTSPREELARIIDPAILDALEKEAREDIEGREEWMANNPDQPDPGFDYVYVHPKTLLKLIAASRPPVKAASPERVVTLGDPATEAHRFLLNERGRAMTVRVKLGDFGDACTVQAVLTGPDTVDEGFMTKLEAEALRDCLIASLPVQSVEGEPVACSCVYCADLGAPELCRGYAAPPKPSEAPAMGWKLVPEEITLAMQHAYFDEIDRNMRRVETDAAFGRFSNNAAAYRAMLAAAPDPESAGKSLEDA